MPPTSILIANSDRDEADELKSVIGNVFEVIIATNPSELTNIANECSIVILDSNFTEHKGLDVLREVTTAGYVPVIMISPPHDPACAIESIRAGGFNYLVKESGYEELLIPAITEAMSRFNDREEMKRVIVALRNEVAELKATALAKTSDGAEAKMAAMPLARSAAERRKRTLVEVVDLLKRGELNLPVYPQINIEFRTLLAENAGVLEITDLLKQDAGITTKLISVANSPIYRGVSEISSLQDAVNRLGLTTTKNYVEVITNRALYITNDATFKSMLLNIWKHSLACAHAAQALAVRATLPAPDEIFSMALLHDIGKLLLIVVLTELRLRGKADNLEFAEVDKFLQAYHGRFGATFLHRWGLPDGFVKVAEYHGNIDRAPSISKSLCAVHCANHLVHQMGYGDMEETENSAVDLGGLLSVSMLHLNSTDLSETQETVQALMADSNTVF